MVVYFAGNAKRVDLDVAWLKQQLGRLGISCIANEEPELRSAHLHCSPGEASLSGSTFSGVHDYLGTPVVPFCPFYSGVPLLELNSRKKGTLIVNGLLRNLAMVS